MSGQPVGLFSPTTARLQTCFSSCLTLTIMVLLLPNEGGEGERNGCVYLMESQRFLPRHVDTSALSFIAPIRKHPPPQAGNFLFEMERSAVIKENKPTAVFSFPPQGPTAPSRFLPTRPSGPARTSQRPAWPGRPTRLWWTRASCGSSEATSSTPPTTTWSRREYPRR